MFPSVPSLKTFLAGVLLLSELFCYMEVKLYSLRMWLLGDRSLQVGSWYLCLLSIHDLITDS
jgi:hypothetical protein